MSRFFKRVLLAVMLAGAVNSASAFSMLGPFANDFSGSVWQVPAIGYDPLGGVDIGGPMNLGEEYRWNIKTITYGFDSSFLNYFGQRGVDEVNKAMEILNNLPKFSKMSTDLTEFPLDTKRVNYRASAVGLLDLKSMALGIMMEEIGLASPERYVWTLRDRRTPVAEQTNYTTIKRNFDPVTLAPSSYVNGTLYTYFIGEFELFGGGSFADAVEVQVDPLAFGFTAVASCIDGFWAGSLLLGEYYTGLTRDDVGGLRYIYGPNNYNVETLIPGTFGSGGSPYDPAGQTNAAVDIALRAGMDKFLFKQAKYDSQLGAFIPIIQSYKDNIVADSKKFKQNTQRLLFQPDVLFTAEDIVLDAAGRPFRIFRTSAASPIWLNNNALNSQAILAGPGQIDGQVVIVFNKIGPFIRNFNPAFLDEYNGFAGFVWGSFDGTTNAPIVYPNGSSIEELEQQVLHGN